ncbi:hypothetical protein SK128_006842 [Halocaridina rubra]|uniref:Uncharacterized protein n=1 Tax=Halocaridina rubra TaxID=373956 RepID=A0AAN8XA99_HALRR
MMFAILCVTITPQSKGGGLRQDRPGKLRLQTLSYTSAKGLNSDVSFLKSRAMTTALPWSICSFLRYFHMLYFGSSPKSKSYLDREYQHQNINSGIWLEITRIKTHMLVFGVRLPTSDCFEGEPKYI